MMHCKKSNHTKIPIGLALMALVIGMTSTVQAKSRLILPPLPQEANQLTTSIWQQLRYHFAADKRIELIKPQVIKEYLRLQKTDTKKLESSKLDLEKAEKLLKEGWSDYKKLKIDSAIKKLQQAKLNFRRLLPFTTSIQKLLTSHLHLGIAFLAKGEETRGKQEIRTMLVLDPARAKRKLNPKHYAPEVIQLYKDLKSEVLALPSANIIFELQPEGMNAWFDGAPLKGTLMEDVPEGEHFLIGRAESFQDYFASKYIVAGENLITLNLQKEVSLDLEQYFAPTQNPYDIPYGIASFLDSMTLKLNGDILFFYRISSDVNNTPIAMEGQLYDQRSQETSAVEKVMLSSSRETINQASRDLVRRLLSQLDNQGYVVTQQVANKSDKEKRSGQVEVQSSTEQDRIVQENLRNFPQKQAAKPWFKKWWVYGAIGAGVLTVVGSLFLFTDLGKSSASTSTLEIPNPAVN